MKLFQHKEILLLFIRIIHQILEFLIKNNLIIQQHLIIHNNLKIYKNYHMKVK